MKLLSQFFLLLSVIVGVAQAVTNFRGVTVAGSTPTTKYTCRTQAQWNELALKAKNNGFKSLRIYSFDCDTLNRASNAAQTHGLTILAGIWVDGTMAKSATSIRNDVEAFRAAYKKYGASRYMGLTIGNELNDSAKNIMNKVSEVRSYLRSVGVNTLVSTVSIWIHIRDNRLLCNGDFVAANAHAFFDRNTVAAKTGDFIFKTVVPSLKAACPGKQLWITESGWPSKGSTYGKAIASLKEQRSALLNLNCACRDDRSVQVFAFELDDTLWKNNNDWERSFGFFSKHDLNGDVFKPC